MEITKPEFRIWDGHKMTILDKLITTTDSIGFCDPNKYYVDIAEDFQNEVIVMQYADFKDKYKKKIYEGDIVKVKRHYISDSFLCPEYIGIVHRSKGQFKVLYKQLDEYVGWSEEILGNIYDNPELVKDNQL